MVVLDLCPKGYVGPDARDDHGDGKQQKRKRRRHARISEAEAVLLRLRFCLRVSVAAAALSDPPTAAVTARCRRDVGGIVSRPRPSRRHQRPSGR